MRHYVLVNATLRHATNYMLLECVLCVRILRLSNAVKARLKQDGSSFIEHVLWIKYSCETEYLQTHDPLHVRAYIKPLIYYGFV